MIRIYTDGACSFNDSSLEHNTGGHGVVVVKDDKIIHEFNGYNQGTTNNREELTAILKAFEYIDKNNILEECTIYSDSAYCVNSLNTWIYSWAKSGWTKKDRQEVKNQDLLKPLLDYMLKYKHIEILKVKGHSSDIYNNRADELAVMGGKHILI